METSKFTPGDSYFPAINGYLRFAHTISLKKRWYCQLENARKKPKVFIRRYGERGHIRVESLIPLLKTLSGEDVAIVGSNVPCIADNRSAVVFRMEISLPRWNLLDSYNRVVHGLPESSSPYPYETRIVEIPENVGPVYVELILERSLLPDCWGYAYLPSNPLDLTYREKIHQLLGTLTNNLLVTPEMLRDVRVLSVTDWRNAYHVGWFLNSYRESEMGIRSFSEPLRRLISSAGMALLLTRSSPGLIINQVEVDNDTTRNIHDVR